MRHFITEQRHNIRLLNLRDGADLSQTADIFYAAICQPLAFRHDSFVGVPLSFILSAHQLAQEENLWRGYGLTPNELFKLILSSDLAYAYGHTLDRLCETIAQQTAIKKIKSNLANCAGLAFENRKYRKFSYMVDPDGRDLFANFVRFNVLYQMTLQRRHRYSPQLTSAVLTKIALLSDILCFKDIDLLDISVPSIAACYQSLNTLPPGIRFDVPLSVNPWFSDLFDVRQNRLGLLDVLPGIVPITF